LKCPTLHTPTVGTNSKKKTASMAKTKTLNGLSYSLAHSYFSTINYYSKGYMSDWIVNSAFDIGIDNVQIDILNKEIFPKELMICGYFGDVDPLFR